MSKGDTEESGKSYVHINGDWEDRKISLFGVVKGFISQLKFGEDLTKVSMPVVFCRPYSLLEEIGARNFVHLDILYELNKIDDPASRMLQIIQWLISVARQEKFHHKPLNPVIGEVNKCKHSEKENPDNDTYLILEQVRHHPPTSAIRLDCPKRNLSIEGFYTFLIEFTRNAVSVTNSGHMEIHFGDEIYVLEKPMPNLMIRNVILGSKLVSWEGDMTIECEQTGYFGKFELSTKGRTNLAKGGVYKKSESADEPLIIVEGKCGGPATWNYNIKHPRFVAEMKDLGKKETKAKKKELIEKQELVTEPEKRREIVPEYQKPSEQPENSSYNIWAPVRKCIIANDMENGDVAKQAIEKGQREKLKKIHEKGEKYKPVYFKLADDGKTWKIKSTEWWKDY